MKISIINNWRVNEDKSGQLDKVDSIFEGDFVDIIEKRLFNHTTHGIFKDNIKTNDNFIGSDIVVIDFDKGLITSEEVSNRLKLYNFVITASTNHNCDKNDGKGVIPRFHLIIELKQTVYGVENYKDLVKYLIEKLNFSGIADDSSASAVRYWKKQKDILNHNYVENPLDITQILEFISNKRSSKERLDFKRRSDAEFKAKLFVKTHRELISDLSIEGIRSLSLCKLIGKIKRMGFGKEECLEIANEHCNLPAEEINKTINSLFKTKGKS